MQCLTETTIDGNRGDNVARNFKSKQNRYGLMRPDRQNGKQIRELTDQFEILSLED